MRVNTSEGLKALWRCTLPSVIIIYQEKTRKYIQIEDFLHRLGRDLALSTGLLEKEVYDSCLKISQRVFFCSCLPSIKSSSFLFTTAHKPRDDSENLKEKLNVDGIYIDGGKNS